MSNYVTIYEEYKHKFFQLPKVFFTNEKYLNMSNNAKVAWSLLRDRSSLSRKNDWFDSDTGRIYFIYKNKELMDILNIKSETTLVRIKKELESAELIEQQRLGFNRPNKIYLLYPIIEEKDVYEIDKIESYQAEPVENENSPRSQEGQGTSKNGAPKNEVPYPQKMEPSNTELSNTDLKDLDTIDTQIDTGKDSFQAKSDKSMNELKKKYFERAFYENQNKVPDELAKVFKVFCKSPEEAQTYYNSINKAKLDVFSKVLEEKNMMLPIMTIDDEPELLRQIVNTFVRVVRKVEKERNIKNPTGYLYKAVYTVIWDYFIPINEVNDWLNEYDN